jgi:hypothetical protein
MTRHGCRIKYHFAAAALLLSAVSWSCVREDFSDCPPIPPVPSDQTLWLEFVPGAMDMTIPPGDMKLAVVYMFDSAGGLFQALAIENPAFNTPYDTGVDLGSDTYDIVAWINPTEPYSVNLPWPRFTRSDQSGGILSLILPEDGIIDETLPMLMHGSLDDVPEPTTDTPLEVTLISNVYDLNITAQGVPLNGDTYMLQIRDNNGSYDFAGNYLDSPDILYQVTVTASPIPGNPAATGDLVFDMRTLRMGLGRNPELTLVNLTTGQQIYPLDMGHADLVDMIDTTVPDADFTSDFTYDIVFDCSDSFEEGRVTVEPTVTIEGWKVKKDDYDIIE